MEMIRYYCLAEPGIIAIHLLADCQIPGDFSWMPVMTKQASYRQPWQTLIEALASPEPRPRGPAAE